MKLFRFEDKKNGIRYITEDNVYKIQKFYKKACWEVVKVTGDGHRTLAHFKYFNEARKYLKENYI